MSKRIQLGFRKPKVVGVTPAVKHEGCEAIPAGDLSRHNYVMQQGFSKAVEQA